MATSNATTDPIVRADFTMPSATAENVPGTVHGNCPVFGESAICGLGERGFSGGAAGFSAPNGGVFRWVRSDARGAVNVNPVAAACARRTRRSPNACPGKVSHRGADRRATVAIYPGEHQLITMGIGVPKVRPASFENAANVSRRSKNQV